MRKVIFSESSLRRIAAIRSTHFNKEETELYKIKLLESIRERLSFIAPREGFKEYYRGPWANTRRVIVMEFKVYFIIETEENVVRVRGIKAFKMK